MNDDLILTEEQLILNEPQHRVWVRVRDATGLLWQENPKLHDLGGIIESITRYGFRIVSNFDANLPNISNGTGAIIDGNGRIEALAQMEKDDTYDLPRGLALDSDGAWCMPLNIGIDADSQQQAEAFALDANNLTLLGSGMDAFDMARLWDETGYKNLLSRLGQEGEFPISVDGDSLDRLLEAELLLIEWPEYDESIADEVEWNECPECGHKWPK